MRYHLESTSGKQIVSNLELPCKTCIEKCNTIGTINYDCGLDGIPKRNGIKISKKGKVFLCCGETRTTKLFREKLSNILYSVPDFEEIKTGLVKEIAMTEHQRYKRIVHNLKSLNAHNIQELYSLVPQEYLTSNITEQLDEIKYTISANLDQCARTFIRIAKHNAHMKSEFTIQDKIVDENPILQIRLHGIRKVLMNVLHTFFIDFDEKNVEVKVSSNYTRIKIDYESIHVAFYHIIENASKYIRPRSVFHISFAETDSELSVNFDMESLHIQPQETNKIFEEGYSGINAQLAKKAGEGIGMARIKKLIELNKATLIINAGRKVIHFDNMNYSKNTFTIVFKNNI